MEFIKASEKKKMKDKKLHLYIYEEIAIHSSLAGAQGLKYSYRPIMECEDLATFNEDDQQHVFPNVSFLSSLLESTSCTPLYDKTLMIEIYETFFDKLKSKVKVQPPKTVRKEKFISRGKFSILNAIKFAKSAVYMCYLTDHKRRVNGKFFISNFSLNSHYTFIDLQIKNNLNIVPVVAVDFSLANLTFDESQYCIHTLKEGKPNDYMDCLKSVNKAFNYFSRFILPIGFGARTIVTKKEDPASNLFSMTGDFMDPFVENNKQLISCYEGTLKTV